MDYSNTISTTSIQKGIGISLLNPVSKNLQFGNIVFLGVTISTNKWRDKFNF